MRMVAPRQDKLVELETFLRRRATSPQADYARARLEELKRQQMTTIAPPAKPEKENKPGSEQRECISAGGAGYGVKKGYAQLMAQTAAVKAAQSCHYVVQMDTLTSSCEPTNNGGWMGAPSDPEQRFPLIPSTPIPTDPGQHSD